MSACCKALCSDGAIKIYMGMGALGGFVACTVGAVYAYNQSSIVERVSALALDCMANNNTVAGCCASVVDAVKGYAVLSPKISTLLNIGSHLLFGGVCLMVGKNLLPGMCTAGKSKYEHTVTPVVVSHHHEDPLVQQPLLAKVDD